MNFFFHHFISSLLSCHFMNSPQYYVVTFRLSRQWILSSHYSSLHFLRLHTSPFQLFSLFSVTISEILLSTLSSNNYFAFQLCNISVTSSDNCYISRSLAFNRSCCESKTRYHSLKFTWSIQTILLCQQFRVHTHKFIYTCVQRINL